MYWIGRPPIRVPDEPFRASWRATHRDRVARFTHALIRQGVYEDIAPPVRRDLHAASFRALIASGAYSAEAAEHAMAANLVGGFVMAVLIVVALPGVRATGPFAARARRGAAITIS